MNVDLQKNYELSAIADWWEITSLDDSLSLLREPYVDPLLRCNVWHIRGRKRDLIIDTGIGVAPLRDAAKHLFGQNILAVATHSHYDHVGGFWEFSERAAHPAEAELLAVNDSAPLLRDEMPWADSMLGGYEIGEVLVTATPHPEWGPASHSRRAAAPTWLIDEGDVIDLGDRAFEVIHLPGHSPGSIGLWDDKSGTLFSGDAIYDGPLLDTFPDSDIAHYCNTIKRLRDLPVNVVHGGHEESFGRQRLIEICDAYLTANEG